MKDQFQVAAGSITGRSHRFAGKNNQDAYCFAMSDKAVAAVVCDGCSAGKHSEVGAKIGARMITGAVIGTADQCLPGSEAEATFWERIRQDVLAQLRVLSKAMGGSLNQAVIDYFLFTTVGVLIKPDVTTVFSIGDGVYFLNDEMFRLGPFPGNEPPYLAYSLLESFWGPDDQKKLQFNFEQIALTEKIESLLIGTDGALDLIAAQDRRVPGKEETVGPISQFWQEDKYFENPDMLRRRLTIVNRDVQQVDWKKQQVAKEKGLLSDDTTMVALRRKPVEKEKKRWKFI